MNVPRIFGREPVVIANFIEGLLVCALAFGWLNAIGLGSDADIAIVMAVVSGGLGIYIAYVTKDTLLGAVTGFIKAAIPLFALYGYDLSQEQAAGILSAVALTFALWQRTQTGPSDKPSLDLSQHSVEVPPDADVKGTLSDGGVIVDAGERPNAGTVL